ncbi:hypothetical protein [Rothia aerolata]|uniref:Tat pathway signal sequence domain protein n=1 Tax=Rothia aerolata TaxID=1812262 RepID=A0A917MPP7_9MICC|nr:hypothetical protein [Rothia aerolata]GGH56917.1 hypothetical protein GCM10007359_01520 [Rothia aerolata]
MSKRHISRRTLAKGAAWAAPVLVATSTVPVYAASNSCIRYTSAVRESDFRYGNDVVDKTDDVTEASLALNSSQLTIVGLDRDEIIQRVEFSWYVEFLKLDQMRAGYDQGFYYPDAEQVSYDFSGLGAGWAPYQINQPSPISIPTDQGTIRKTMWSLSFANTTNIARYSTDATGCKTAEITNLVTRAGGFNATLSDVVPVTGDPGNYAPAQIFYWTVTTNKRTIEFFGYLYDNDMVGDKVQSRNAGTSDNWTGSSD